MFKYIKLILGVTLSSLSIAMVINCGLGAFAITTCNIALSNWFRISLGLAGFISEAVMLLYASAKGEGLGWTAIVNATYGSFMIDIFSRLLPHSIFLSIGLIILPVAWAITGSVGLGDTGSNLLTNALVKSTGKSIRFIRTIIEVTVLLIGFLGARSFVTWFTIVMTLTIGYIAQFIYKLIKYNPTDIEHKYLIQLNKLKNKEMKRI